MSRDGYNREQFSGTRQSIPYTNPNIGLLSPTGSVPYITGAVPNMQYRDSSGGNYQPTLGQMAEQIQERARAEAALAARMGGSTGSEITGQGNDEYYDYGGGGGDNYDDDGGDNDGDGEDESGQLATGNESTGRWTRAEHELFLQALKKYGKEWKKVASMVKTRTVVQTRTHAQKYFQKLTKTAGGAMGSIASAGPSFPSGRGATPGSGNGSADKSGAGLFYHKQNKRGGGAPMGMSPPAAMGADLGNSMAVMQMAQMHPSMLLNSNIGMIPANMVSSYLPTTQGYGEMDNQDYYESMEVAALMGELNKVPTAVQTPLQLSMGMPDISTSGIDPPDFPEPSPAACGKRKHAELQAAQMLAASSSSKAPRAGGALSASAGYGSVRDYADALISASNGNGSGVKSAGGPQLVRDLSSGSVPGGVVPGNGMRRPRVNLTLSIVDPSESGASNDPGTPWEAAIQHLEQETANAPLTSRLMRSNSFSNYTMPAVPVNTPSEQRSFINKVRALVREADLAGLASLLGAAEYSAQVTVKTEDSAADGEDDAHTPGDNQGDGRSAGEERPPVSNLLAVFTPDGAGGVGNGADAESGSNGDSEARALTSMNTQFNSGVPAGSPRKYSASQVARSLNRVERNSRSVLMEVASTTDPAINQTLLYSMCMLLIEHGAIAGLPDSRGSTALHYAAAQGHERVGRLLLTKGCPLNLQNVDGDTATHIAARNGHVAFIEMLADLGANFHIRNGASMCALDLLGSKSSDDAQRAHLRKLMLTAEPRLRTLVLYHEEFQEHTARRPSDWEGPDRLDAIMTRLRDKGEFPEHEVEISNRFEKADVELLGRVHSPEYIGFVNMLSKQVQNEANDKEGGKDASGSPAVLPFTPQVQRFVRRQHSEELKSGESCDTSFSVGTLSAARRAAGAVAFAVDRVMLGRNRNAFCAVRPPGHHAGYRGLLDGANSCGFCIFNNVAAGALHALVAHQCERVAIIDLDVHHGNGTEDIVRRYAHPSRLFFFSLHLYDKDDLAAQAAAAAAVPKTTTDRPIDAVTAGTEAGTPTGRSYEFYPGTGVRDDHVHNIINVPMTPLWAVDDSHRANKSTPTHPHGQFVGREGYRQAISLRLIPTLRAFNPTLILLSAGFDAAAGDVGNCRQFPGEATSRMGIDLQPEDFAWATTEIMKIADICCGGRLVSVLEGGYGEYAPVQPAKNAVHHVPTTRGASRHQGTTASATTEKPTVSLPDTPKVQSTLNRALLGKVAAAHVHRLMDPYGATHESSAAPVATTASN